MDFRYRQIAGPEEVADGLVVTYTNYGAYSDAARGFYLRGVILPPEVTSSTKNHFVQADSQVPGEFGPLQSPLRWIVYEVLNTGEHADVTVNLPNPERSDEKTEFSFWVSPGKGSSWAGLSHRLEEMCADIIRKEMNQSAEEAVPKTYLVEAKCVNWYASVYGLEVVGYVWFIVNHFARQETRVW